MKKFLFLLWPFFALSQSYESAHLDSLFNRIDEYNKASGAALLAEDGKTIYARAFGWSQIDGSDTLASAVDTRYRIGSISKTFTAALIMLMVEQGKLDLKQKLADFFPDIPQADSITLDQLLSHRSGIFNFTADPNYLGFMMKSRSREEMLRVIAAYAPVFEPGERYEYSNSNYVLLGYILEEVTGQSYAKNLELLITEPLGLDNTYYGDSIAAGQGEAFSYSRLGTGEESMQTHMSIPGGAGALVSTVGDLADFAFALFNARLLDSTSLLKILPGKDEAYGYGLARMGEENGIAAYGHGGSIDDFQSTFYHYLAPLNLTVVVFTNTGNYYPDQIASQLVQDYLNDPLPLPEFADYEVLPEQMDRYAGTYVNDSFPLDIEIYREGQVLKARATGQMPIELDPRGPGLFVFDRAGIRLEFFPEEDRMDFQQGTTALSFKRLSETTDE